MRTIGLQIVFAAVLSASAALAQDTTSKPAQESAGFIDRMWNALTGSDSDTQTNDAAKGSASVQPRDAAEPMPMKVTGSDTSDKDSYKPDAGDSGH
jgi:hypothetical protein